MTSYKNNIIARASAIVLAACISANLASAAFFGFEDVTDTHMASSDFWASGSGSVSTVSNGVTALLSHNFFYESSYSGMRTTTATPMRPISIRRLEGRRKAPNTRFFACLRKQTPPPRNTTTSMQTTRPRGCSAMSLRLTAKIRFSTRRNPSAARAETICPTQAFCSIRPCGLIPSIWP